MTKAMTEEPTEEPTEEAAKAQAVPGFSSGQLSRAIRLLLVEEARAENARRLGREAKELRDSASKHASFSSRFPLCG